MESTNQNQGLQFSPDQIALLKRTICQGATDDEIDLFVAQCKRTQLDPFAKQIHPVMRYDKKKGVNVMSVQTGIDGYRLIAERTGQYQGQTIALWCGEDGQWTDVWLKPSPPAAAKVGIHKAGFKEPVYAVALWAEYVQQYYKDGKWVNSPMWAKMGTIMISKCAEALGLRKAFPQELSGIYTNEEMQQADAASYTVDQHQPAASMTPQIEPPTETEEMKTAWRKLRAAANKSFSAAKSMAEYRDKKKAFEAYAARGEGIWSQLTHHNTEETFGALADSHRARIEGDEELASPAGILRWIEVVTKSDMKGLAQRISEYRSQLRLQNTECEQALEDRAISLGLQTYRELEESPDDVLEHDADANKANA